MGVASDAPRLNSPQSDTCFALGSKSTKVTLTLWGAVDFTAWASTVFGTVGCWKEGFGDGGAAVADAVGEGAANGAFGGAGL
jgi:hypothetical protein